MTFGDFRPSIAALLSALVVPWPSPAATPVVGPLATTPQSIVAGQATPVTVSLQITSGTVLSGGVNLLQVDSTGKTISVLGTLNPVGNGVYTSVFTFAPPTGTTQILLQASVAFQGVLQRVKSPVYTLAVVPATLTLSINPAALTFPSRTVGTSSSAQSFTITNTGNAAVSIKSTTTSGDFAISANTCPASLPVNAECAVIVIFTPTITGTRTSSAVITDNAIGSPQSVALTGTGQSQQTGPFTITSFNPTSGTIGTIVKVVLANFAPPQGTGPAVTIPATSGGSITAPLSTVGADALSFVVPAGAITGLFTITLGSQTATSATPFGVTTSTAYTLNVGPSTANLLPGHTVTYAVTLNSSSGFSGLATLSAAGLPAGVQSSFKPMAITTGQTAVLTLSAPSNQASSTSTVSVSASATIDGQAVSKSATATLQVSAITTSFLAVLSLATRKKLPSPVSP